MWKIVLASGLLAIATAHAGAEQLIHINLHWINDSRGCKVWDSLPSPRESVTWTGGCVDGYADGKGKLTWFVDGRPHGTYEGDMKAGHNDGHGVQIWSSGARYDGEWKNDRADGAGTYRAADGEVCSGTWVNGCFRGKNCAHAIGNPDCKEH